MHTMSASILHTLKTLHYTGDWKNFTFDKFMTAHIEQHNLADSLIDLGQDTLSEPQKIHFFLDGIQDPSLFASKNTVIADPEKYLTFEAVKMQFVNYIQLTAATRETPTIRTLAAVGRGQGGGGTAHGWGGNRDREAARKRGIPSQAEVDVCTHITKTFYPHEEYARMTPAEKQKVWQLKNTSKTNVTPAKHSNSGSRMSVVSSLSTPAANSDDDDLFLLVTAAVGTAAIQCLRARPVIRKTKGIDTSLPCP